MQGLDKYRKELPTLTMKVILNYVIGQGKAVETYQLVNYLESEGWHVLSGGYLIGRLQKVNNAWLSTIPNSLNQKRLFEIGSFIDAQNFDHISLKIKNHWATYIQEVIMQSDSAYLVICLKNINFGRFKLLFISFIGDLVEVPWPVGFKVYNSDFSDEFLIEVK
ncbi:hypothetical protein [Pedobacter rhodius]|uniref:Uncharacterized protein n=1 Tax=Pedobacter rhodius TaxID=3004098 RepID=A0ABT4KX42_9SPHI|nr:hypothetical protein [Pedobacter sp. SJ11]MCZ4223505.1 hypothetical protein [Pedobacter sp. SJ11]